MQLRCIPTHPSKVDFRCAEARATLFRAGSSGAESGAAHPETVCTGAESFFVFFVIFSDSGLQFPVFATIFSFKTV